MSGHASTNTLLQIGDGASPEEFVTIAEVGDIDGLKLSGNMHDTSTHSLGTPWMTQIIGLLKNEGVSFPMNFGPTEATHTFAAATGLGYIFTHRQLKTYRLIWPGFEENAVEFAAYVSNLGQAAPVDGILKANCTLSATGAPTFDVDSTA